MLYFGVCVSLSQCVHIQTLGVLLFASALISWPKEALSLPILLLLFAVYVYSVVCVFVLMNSKNCCTPNWKIFANKSTNRCLRSATMQTSEYTTKSHAKSKNCSFSRAHRANQKSVLQLFWYIRQMKQLFQLSNSQITKLFTNSLMKAGGKSLWFWIKISFVHFLRLFGTNKERNGNSRIHNIWNDFNWSFCLLLFWTFKERCFRVHLNKQCHRIY